MTTSTLQVPGRGATTEAEGSRACGPLSGRAAAFSEPGLAVPMGPVHPTRAAASPILGAQEMSAPSPGPDRSGVAPSPLRAASAELPPCSGAATPRERPGPAGRSGNAAYSLLQRALT